MSIVAHIQPPSHLEYNLLHLFIRGLELSDKDQHHLPGVVVCILSIHQWNQVPNCFEESSQTLETRKEMYHEYTLLLRVIWAHNKNCSYLLLPSD